jgi:integrase
MKGASTPESALKDNAMPVHKRKRRGKTDWYFKFDLPGASRDNRRIIRGFGFATRQEAIAAEASRRIDEQKKLEMAKAGGNVDAPVPKTLGSLLEEFFEQHAQENLAPKTVERYREQAKYISPDLLARPIAEITPLHLNREWIRLLKSGGHTRKAKTPRPLSAKTVRNVAGVISSAYSRSVKWGLTTVNPVTNSEPPKVKRHHGIAFTPAQQRMVIEAATSPWCLRTYLEVVAATGCRRGEVLALRWSDIQDGRAMIARSLSQTRDLLEFKGTKTDEPRAVTLPTSAIAALNAHRKRQDEFRRQFGADYRADLDLIFANHDGTPFRPDSISAAVSLLFRRLKLPKGASLHSLRHTHTSHLLANGVPLPAVSARLGHGSIRTTQEIYSHMIHGQDDEAARKWEEFQSKRTGDAPQQEERVQ